MLAPSPRIIQLVSGLDAALETVKEPVVLIGNSMGGWISATWAEKHPERVAGLVLVNSAGFKQSVDLEVLLPTTREAVRRKNEVVMGEHAPNLPGVFLDGLLEIQQDPRLHSLLTSIHTDAVRLEGRLGAGGFPISLVWGTPDPFFPKEGYLSRVQKELPEAQTILLEGCAHSPQYSCPEALVKAIQQLSP